MPRPMEKAVDVSRARQVAMAAGLSFATFVLLTQFVRIVFG